MIQTYVVLAAFAVFLTPKNTRLAALLCLFLELSAYPFEALPNDETFRFYYYACGLSAFGCGVVIMKQPYSKENVIYALLFLAVLVNAWVGCFLYMNYLPSTVFNFIGLYVILTQLMIMTKGGIGELRSCVNNAKFYIRSSLSI